MATPRAPALPPEAIRRSRFEAAVRVAETQILRRRHPQNPGTIVRNPSARREVRGEARLNIAAVHGALGHFMQEGQTIGQAKQSLRALRRAGQVTVKEAEKRRKERRLAAVITNPDIRKSIRTPPPLTKFLEGEGFSPSISRLAVAERTRKLRHTRKKAAGALSRLF